jgi:hypothetical protein
MKLNKKIINIHLSPTLLFNIGAKIADPYGSKGNPDRPFQGNQYNKVILC